MNNRFINIFTIIACSTLFVAGCGGDNSSYETPPSSEDTPTNAGVISQNNFSIYAEDLYPPIFDDPASDTFTFTTVKITVKVGDRNNQKLTDAHTVYFKTEWGLIDPFCVTKDSECSVNWQTSGDPLPADHKNTIMAYTIGEESFTDVNGNAIFDDPDNATPPFDDIEEPYVDSNRNFIYDFGEPIADVNPYGQTGEHDYGDFYFNGEGCTHSSLCSNLQKYAYVWDDVQLNMDGPP